MLTALISLISGLVSGILPDLVKEFRESRQSSRERAFLKEQHERELERIRADADVKIRESEFALATAEATAYKDSLAAVLEQANKPTGNAFIDGFNAVLRPTMVSGIMILFFWIAIVYVHGVMAQYGAGKLTVVALNDAVWGSIVGESIIATIGYLFGYRSARKIAGA